jgi:transposase
MQATLDNPDILPFKEVSMANKRLSMRKIKDVLRLHFEKELGNRQIGRSLSISHNSVSGYLRRARAAGIGWPLPKDLSDQALETLLFPPPPKAKPNARPVPNWVTIHTERKRRSVTLALLWEEYKAENPDGIQYSQFCERYRAFTGKLSPSMRQVHLAGEKLFVDYAGQTLPIQDPGTGEVREAQVFVAVLGASNYTFAEATWSQGLSDWVGSHVRAFEFFGGVPHILVPDNLRSGVTKALRYEPVINPTYNEMAAHYGTAVVPARVRKPKDKSKAEGGVLIVERWILARLRNRTFFSLHEANEVVSELLADMNSRPFQKLPGCRREAFENLDLPALLPLPGEPYEYAEWKIATVNIDYHIDVDRHYYSVPHSLIKKRLDVRITERTIECFHKGQRVASHVRSRSKGRHTTILEHMPKSHREYAKWTPERIKKWAGKIGPHVMTLVEKVMESRRHPVQGFRAALGIIRLAKEYDNPRLEAACARALNLGSHSYKSVASILKNGLDQQPILTSLENTPTPAHGNVRGADYYGKEGQC